MSPSTATLPFPAHSLYAETSRFLASLFTAPTAPTAQAARPTDSGVWNLFRMSAGMNSIASELLIDRIVHD